MSTPWLRTVNQALKMYEYGASVLELVWEEREWAPRVTAPGANRRQYTMLKKLAVRPSNTIIRFNYDDNGGPISVTQMAVDSEGKSIEVDIPIEVPTKTGITSIIYIRSTQSKKNVTALEYLILHSSLDTPKPTLHGRMNLALTYERMSERTS